MDRDYFLDDLRTINVLNEVDEHYEKHIFRAVKQYKPRSNPFEELNESDFKTNFNFSKRTAIYIIDVIKDDIAGDTRGGSIPPYLQVLTAIRTWACSEIQDNAGDLAGMSQSTVSNVCRRVSSSLAQRRADFIKMPNTEQEQNKIMTDFYSICGFKQVIGAIGCTQIRISKVSGERGQSYINNKGYSSLNVQVVSNAKLEIMDIVAHTGSTHDSKIFNESRIKMCFENAEFRGRLLGDSMYTCSPYLFTPILHPRTPKEEHYNRAHIQTRNTVQHCFDIWKQRFQCLLKGFNTNLENTKMYIIALAVLHNIAILNDDYLDNIIIKNIKCDPIEHNKAQENAAFASFIEDNF